MNVVTTVCQHRDDKSGELTIDERAPRLEVRPSTREFAKRFPVRLAAARLLSGLAQIGFRDERVSLHREIFEIDLFNRVARKSPPGVTPSVRGERREAIIPIRANVNSTVRAGLARGTGIANCQCSTAEHYL